MTWLYFTMLICILLGNLWQDTFIAKILHSVLRLTQKDLNEFWKAFMKYDELF